MAAVILSTGRFAAAAVSVLAIVAGPSASPATGTTPMAAPDAAVDARCVDCPPAPLPCPPCFACIQIGPEGLLNRIPAPECPFPHSAPS